jgi:hypothetical protein
VTSSASSASYFCVVAGLELFATRAEWLFTVVKLLAGRLCCSLEALKFFVSRVTRNVTRSKKLATRRSRYFGRLTGLTGVAELPTTTVMRRMPLFMAAMWTFGSVVAVGAPAIMRPESPARAADYGSLAFKNAFSFTSVFWSRVKLGTWYAADHARTSWMN